MAQVALILDPLSPMDLEVFELFLQSEIGKKAVKVEAAAFRHLRVMSADDWCKICR